MSEFNLEVEMTARTDQLESAMQAVQSEADQTASSMERAGDEGNSAFARIAVAAAAVVAAMAALEMGVGILGAAFSASSGDSEKLRASLEGLPIVGGLISKFYQLGEAMEYSSDFSNHLRADLLQVEAAARDLSMAIGLLNEEIANQEKLLQLEGKNELEIAVAVYEKKSQLIQKESSERLKALDAEYMERLKAIEEQNLNEETAKFLYEEARKTKHEEMAAIKKNGEERLKILELELGAAHEAHDLSQQQAEETRSTMEENAKAAANAEAEIEKKAFAQKMEDEAVFFAEHMSGISKAERARKEAAEAEKARRAEIAANEAAAIVKMSEIQKQIDEETAMAKKAMQGQTGTFSTAGGSFTTGVKAQLDNSKILNKLSEESRDFLAQIVQNTARLGGGMVGGFN